MSNNSKCDCGEKPLLKMKVPASLCPGIASQPTKPHVCHSGLLVKLESTSFIVACVSRTRLLCPAGCYLQLTRAIASCCPGGARGGTTGAHPAAHQQGLGALLEAARSQVHPTPPATSSCTHGGGRQNHKSGLPRSIEVQFESLLMGNGGQSRQSPKEGTRGARRHGQSWPSCCPFAQLEGKS